MSQTVEFNLLGDAGYTGTLNDRRKQFYLANGYDNEFTYLRSLGYTGTVNDMRYQLAQANGLSMSGLIAAGGLIAFAGAGISFISNTVSGASSSLVTDLTSLEASTGDTLLIFAANAGFGAASLSPTMVSAGWTSITPGAYWGNSGTTDCNGYLAWKTMGGTPDTSVEINPQTDANKSAGLYVIKFSNLDAVTPFTVASAVATGECDPPTATANADEIHIYGGAIGSDDNPTGWTVSDWENADQVHAAGGLSDIVVGIGYTTSTGAAVNPSATTTVGGGADASVAFNIIANPA